MLAPERGSRTLGRLVCVILIAVPIVGCGTNQPEPAPCEGLPGTERCACGDGATCAPGLECHSDVCVRIAGDGGSADADSGRNGPEGGAMATLPDSGRDGGDGDASMGVDADASTGMTVADASSPTDASDSETVADASTMDSGSAGDAGTMDASAPDSGAANDAANASDASDPSEEDAGSDDCTAHGLDLDGLVYSPGGSVLPDGCRPFHPVTNNPYAVRCVDAWPWYQTALPGDDACILPPPPGGGIQVGVHPQDDAWFAEVSQGDMSGYDNLDPAWTIGDGEEDAASYQTGASNPSARSYYRAHARGRQGLHHMIAVLTDSSVPHGWVPSGPPLSGAVLLRALGEADDTPVTHDEPPEDAGLYRAFPASPGLEFYLQHLNTSGGPLLKEVWVNLWWKADASTEAYDIFGLAVSQPVALAIDPGASEDLHYAWDIATPTRLLSLLGHRHAWTSNFSVWVERLGGQTEILYQSFDWRVPPRYRYDSLAQNPVPSGAASPSSDGASSGVLELGPGDELHFNCHVEYTATRAAEIGAPNPSAIGTLRFATDLIAGEMCMLYGQTAGAALPTPVPDAATVPGFATVD